MNPLIDALIGALAYCIVGWLTGTVVFKIAEMRKMKNPNLNNDRFVTIGMIVCVILGLIAAVTVILMRPASYL